MCRKVSCVWEIQVLVRSTDSYWQFALVSNVMDMNFAFALRWCRRTNKCGKVHKLPGGCCVHFHSPCIDLVTFGNSVGTLPPCSFVCLCIDRSRKWQAKILRDNQNFFSETQEKQSWKLSDFFCASSFCPSLCTSGDNSQDLAIPISHEVVV